MFCKRFQRPFKFTVASDKNCMDGILQNFVYTVYVIQVQYLTSEE